MNVRLSITLTFDTSRTAELSDLRHPRTLPPRKFLGAPFYLEAEWTPRSTECGQKKRNGSIKKFPNTLPGIEPGTSRLAAPVPQPTRQCMEIIILYTKCWKGC